MNSKQPLTEKQLIRRIEQKENKINRLSGRASQNIGNLRLNEGINGSWKKLRYATVSCGNLSAEEDKLKELKRQLDELRATENEYILNNFPQIVESNLRKIKKFIAKQLADYTDSDYWIEFNGKIDVQFSENDDEDSPNFGRMEFYAYPIVKDKNGNHTTDTSECVQIELD